MKGRRTLRFDTLYRRIDLARLQRRLPRAVRHARALGHQRQAEGAHAARLRAARPPVGRLVHRRRDRARREEARARGRGDAGQVLPQRGAGSRSCASARSGSSWSTWCATAPVAGRREPHRARHGPWRRPGPGRRSASSAVGLAYERAAPSQRRRRLRRGGGRRRDAARPRLPPRSRAPTPSSIWPRARTRGTAARTSASTSTAHATSCGRPPRRE